MSDDRHHFGRASNGNPLLNKQLTPEYDLDADIIRGEDRDEQLEYENAARGTQPGRKSEPLRGIKQLSS